MGVLALIATVSGTIQNIGVIASALASLFVVVPYIKLGVIYTINGVKYIAVKAKDGSITLVNYIKSKVSKDK